MNGGKMKLIIMMLESEPDPIDLYWGFEPPPESSREYDDSVECLDDPDNPWEDFDDLYGF